MAYREKDTKKWTAQWFETNVMGEKKKRRKRGFETKREALEFERSKKLSNERSMDMKLSDFIEIYFSDKQNDLKDRTIKNKRYMMQQHIVPYFGNQMMSEIKASQIIQWQNEIQKKGYSDSYLRMIQNQLTSLFTHAAKIYDLPVNPCKKVKRMGNKELFDEAVERYNVGKRKDRQITNYYEKIRQGKQEKLFHEVIFQIGNREDMAVGTEAGDLAVNVLDEYVKDFQKRNPTLRVFSCYLHQDEATPHLHIDFIPYVTGWKGKGMDTRVSLKQALKSLGFQGGNKHDTELNQWINHEKEVLAETAKQYGIEWEQKGTHEEHLDVYNFKKQERKKEVQELEQEKEHLTAEKEELTAQIAESRADIQNLKDDKEQAIKAKQEAEQKAGSAEKELKSLEDRREQLQPIMDSVSKEIKEYGTVKMLLPEAGTLERAVTYRDKKIKPLFLQIKNKVAVMAAQVKELTKEVEGWKRKYQKVKQKYNAIQRELDDIRKDNQKLSEEKDILQGVSDRYDRVVRVLGIETVDTAVQQDIQNEKVLEEKRRMEQMPKGNIHERLAWGMKKSEMENQQRKKTKSKNREMER